MHPIKKKPLRDLKQNSNFQSLNEKNMWIKLKSDLCNVPVFQYFNPNKKIVVSVIFWDTVS